MNHFKKCTKKGTTRQPTTYTHLKYGKNNELEKLQHELEKVQGKKILIPSKSRVLNTIVQ